jgi:hypothetical protein
MSMTHTGGAWTSVIQLGHQLGLQGQLSLPGSVTDRPLKGL